MARRVEDAADEILRRSRSVSAVEVFTRLGWLRSAQVDEWRQGRHDSLDACMPVRADRVAEAAEALRAWAEKGGLDASEAAYTAATRDRRPLRFTASGDPAVERALRVHWLSPDLTPAQRARLDAKRNEPPDLVAVLPSGPWTCAGCRGGGDHQVMEGDAPLCLACADLDHLVFLPSGDAALSRRAKKESGLSAVVVQYNRRRKRYERRGVLVEEEALRRAEERCLADEDARARRRDRDRDRRAEQDLDLMARMTERIVALFPGCPPGRAEEIAGHAAVRGSGRVGRTAAGRELDEEAVTLAVVASVRHLDTGYDEMLMNGVPRAEARAAIRSKVDAVLTRWRTAPPRP